MSLKQSILSTELGDKYNESSSIESLYSQHNSWLIGWLCKKIRCPQNAADLAQDTFLRVISLSDIPTISEPKAWLLTIAKRILIDKSRRAKIEEAYLQELKISSETRDEVPSSEQILIAVQLLELVSRVINQLADKPKKAFLLRHIDGFTQIEIAEKLSVSTRMVRKYLVQSLVLCHEVVSELEDE